MSRAYCGNRAIAVLNIFLVVVLVIGMAKHFSFSLVMAALRSRCGHYIFSLWFLSIILSFYSPNLSGRRLDAYHTLTHGVVLVRIYNAGLKCAARGSLQMQDPKKLPKIAIWAPSHKFVGLYLGN